MSALSRDRYRDMTTERLLEEASCWRWDWAELETDAAADPDSVRFLTESRAFIDDRLAPIAAELERRRRLRASPYAPPWPTVWPDRRAEINAIKAALDLPAFVETMTGTRLRRSGRQLVGLCPLHAEQTPSFTVDPRQHLWHCFGCKAGGDVITLAMAFYNIEDFPSALTFLAPIAGVEGERTGVSHG
ncbi:MAG: CHC2 zinc finger domain-containing protein [Chloroflexota bacterium]|nr:CHC2 zinc finger domain-containing protein [Chloroflexota bacterium]